MEKRDGIRIFEDKEFLSRVARASLLVLAGGFVLGIFAWMVFPWFRFPFTWGGAAASVCVLIASFLVHEAVHGLFFKLFAPAGARIAFGANWKLGMLYASAEGVAYSRRRYQVIIIAPSIAVTALLLIGGVLSGHVGVAFALAVVHLSGCTGDWGYLREIARDASIDRCGDTSWGVRFYHVGEPLDSEEDDPR